MDDIIGFLIFLIIVAVSIIGRISSERKAAQNRDKKPERPLTLDELPEATRRMFFGDGEGEIIVAKPKKPPVIFEDLEGPKKAIPVPVPARQVVLEPSRPFEPPPVRRPQAFESVEGPVTPRVRPSRPVVQPVRPQQRIQPQRPRQPVPGRQQQPAQFRQQQQPCPQVVPQGRPAADSPAPVQKAAPGPAPAGRGSARLKRHELMAMLRTKNGLKQGILLREILGPPKSFEM
jgi:hypothetical protein